MRSISVCGTRPEILRLSDWETEVIFTGQHFDEDMGKRFISGLSPRTFHYLPSDIDHSDLFIIASEIMEKIRGIGNPDVIIVHGDTRSAMAGALVAHTLKIPLAHTEAGVRSDDETIEQKHRKQIDKWADFNFCPVPIAVEYLRAEGITKNVFFVGDTLYDLFLKERKPEADFVFVTIHRAENVENKERLTLLIDNLKDLGTVVFPVHPHTRKCLDKFGIRIPDNVLELPPLNHAETIKYIKDAKYVITDSGGVQREALWSGTPCKIARPDSEWNYYSGAFGNGTAGEKIREILEKNLTKEKV